ncbi:endolytic transglycosylase MltG [Patescibacteria group bacterium]|nr:endolytic transglycosylase MltG [Patescibacteria group bacterium]
MKRLILAGGLLVLLVIGTAFWWKVSLLPVNTSDKTNLTFVVAKGDTVREVSNNLKEKGLIRNQIVYFLLVRLGLEKNPQAGTFELTPAMSTPEIAKALTFGMEEQVKITIPEGWRSSEIISYLQKQGLSEPVGTWNEEGKYFPETYLVPRTATIDSVRQLMRQTFDARVASVTPQQLIVASMVEREAKHPQDRPLIASVIYNRLEAGMSLDIDATVQYALGYWKQNLTLDDLKIKSLYNTYQNAGLPPGPISNPGLASIQAAINPAKTDYLYYVADKNGVSHFAKTLQEHNANVANYVQ